MSSINKITILGNVGRDPETRYAASGKPICNVSIATSRAWTDKQTGEKREETEWHRVVFMDRLAEIAGQYLAKGSKCYVEGRIKSRKYADKDGIERTSVEIMAHDLVLLSSADGAARRSDKQDESASGKPAAKPAGKQAGFDEMEDDIPF
jgi:single-strand DNA-binding protein